MEGIKLKETPLYELHLKAQGKIIDFNGWALPVQYESILAEHEAVRTKAGLFDVTHMGEFIISGAEAEQFINYMVTNDISKLRDHQIMYSPMCYPHGGVVDDLLIYKKSGTEYMVVVNASNTEKDLKWLEEHQEGFEVIIQDQSMEIGQIAIQGPKAEEILQHFCGINLKRMKFYTFEEDVILAGVLCLISRTGYTGEDGFEIYASNRSIKRIWRKILEYGREKGLKPAGLGCRDTLRFEAALPLYGHELSETISPLQAGLGFFVKLNKENFIGKEALVLQKQDIDKKIVGIELIDKGIIREGYEVYGKENQLIGHVTTGYKSPSIKKSLGLALVNSEYSKLGTKIFIKVRKKMLEAEVVNKPFYKKQYKK